MLSKMMRKYLKQANVLANENLFAQYSTREIVTISSIKCRLRILKETPNQQLPIEDYICMQTTNYTEAMCEIMYFLI